MVPESMIDVLVSWRDNHLKVEMDSNSDVKELGLKLVTLTNVKPETMKLLIPLSTSKGSKLLIPFSAEHSSLPLQEVSNLEGKPIRMLGSFENEIQAVSQNDSKLDSRIIGFDEEEKRLRQRLIDTPHSSLKLPHGAYIFCNFRTLHIPGIELNPPASEALKRMHMLACDPGIISLMNKHRWRVGIMTEMAPVGYVGISPKCLLGFNKNHGEEISLRLRTDDLKGFRKYESIKKTLLHELAHMVYSEHDANFYALDKQLNEEANTLDWTKSKSHTLSGTKISNHYGDEVNVQTSYHSIGKKFGGANLMSLNSARASSVNAAYNRYILSSMSSTEETKTFLRNINEDVRHVMEDHVSSTTSKPVPDNSISKDEPDPDDGVFKNEPDPDDGVFKNEPDPDDSMVLDPDDSIMTMEPDPDESVREPDDSLNLRSWNVEPGHNDSLPTVDDMLVDRPMVAVKNSVSTSSQKETPDGGCCRQSVSRRTDSFGKPDLNDSLAGENTFSGGFPDPNEKISGKISVNHEKIKEQLPDASGSLQTKLQQMHTFPERGHKEPDPDDSISDGIQDGQSMKSEPDVKSNMTVKEKDELERIEEPVVVICQRLQKAIESLRSESTQAETAASLQTLFKIIKNVIEHPDDMKFGRLRKDNRLFQKTVANHKAAMEILTVIGFCEDILTDDIGRLETYMVLKRNDPGLLWLAKSSLELALG